MKEFAPRDREPQAVWRPGLRFEQLKGGILDLTTSTNYTAAAFDITAYPLFMQALDSVPERERVGPVIIDDEGVPLRRRHYQDLYREVANAAGVPDAVWNMFARHSGVTEAHESEAALVDIGKHAQHSDLNTTNRHYIVLSIETSWRVARARVAHQHGIPDRFRTTVARFFQVVDFVGTAGWTRTTDLLIHSLCQVIDIIACCPESSLWKTSDCCTWSRLTAASDVGAARYRRRETTKSKHSPLLRAVLWSCASSSTRLCACKNKVEILLCAF